MTPITNKEIQNKDQITQELVITQAAVGALASLILLINPIAGALFGVIQVAVSSYVMPHIDKFLNDYFDIALTSQVKKWAIEFFAGIAIAAIVVTMLGFPISFAAAFGLCLAMIPISLAFRCSEFLQKNRHDFTSDSGPMTASYTTVVGLPSKDYSGYFSDTE